MSEMRYDNSTKEIPSSGQKKIHEKAESFPSFEKFLARDVRLLQISGLHSMNSVFTGNNVRATSWEAVAFAIGITHIFFVASCEFATITRVWRRDPNYAIGSFTAMFSGLLCAIKGLRLWFWRDEFRKLLRWLALMWDDGKFRVRVKNENIDTAASTTYMGKCYIIMVLVLIISYAVRPYILLLSHHWIAKATNVTYDYTVTIYPTTYPFFATDTMLKYIICVTWEQFVIIWVALYWMSSDIIFAQLTTHTAIQFRVLRHDLEFVTDDNDNDRDSLNEKLYVHRLSAIAKRHRDLYSHCEMIESIYNPIIFMTMLLTGINMCFCVFRFEKEVSHGNWDEVAKYSMHAVTLIVQALIYCGYADKLTYQTSLMARAAYDCQWVDRSKEFKILLHIIMMRSQRVFNCTAYGFFFINLNQITAIGNTAASYFALLKTMT